MARSPVAAPKPSRSGGGRSAAALPYSLMIEGATSEVIGTAGLTPAKLDLWLRRLEPHVERLRTQYAEGTLPHLRIPRATADIDDAEPGSPPPALRRV